MSDTKSTNSSDDFECSYVDDAKSLSNTISHITSYNSTTVETRTPVGSSYGSDQSEYDEGEDSFLTDSNSGQLITISSIAKSHDNGGEVLTMSVTETTDDKTTISGSLHSASSNNDFEEGTEKSDGTITEVNYSEGFESPSPKLVKASSRYTSTFSGDYSDDFHQQDKFSDHSKHPKSDKPVIENTSTSYSSYFYSQTHEIDSERSEQHKVVHPADTLEGSSPAYSSDFDDVSKSSRIYPSDSSQTQSDAQYSYDFDTTAEEYKPGSSPSDTISYRYTSDEFEDSVYSSQDRGSHSSGSYSLGVRDAAPTQEQLEQELLYCKAARRILEGKTTKSKSAASLKKAPVSIPVPAKKMRNYGPVNNFIASSLANIRESNAEKTGTTEQTRKRSSYFDELEAKPLPLKPLPANHSFVSQAERLRLENIITSMKQRSAKLSAEIKEHEGAAEAMKGDQNGREFALPRKIRLERAEFVSKLENHQANMNTVNMIGMIASDLPRPTDDPENIWRRLMNTASRQKH